MDTSDPDITFDDRGVCNHCRQYAQVEPALPFLQGEAPLRALVAKIKAAGAGRRYDCIVGLSGGVDSSYVAYKTAELGLRPLAVHLDNGWDSELAVRNIENIVKVLGIELHTHVIDWAEFRGLQVAYLKSSVVDTEVLTDHAILATLFRTAVKERVRYILSGSNVVTELIMPPAWNYRKSDLRNLRAIVRRNGGPRIRTFPTASTLQVAGWQYLRGVRIVHLLDYLDYDKAAAIELLGEKLGWRDYGGKHRESTFTSFYQTFILWKKYGIDKRRAHLSTLINAGQVTRDQALEELRAEPIDAATVELNVEYVLKKLGLSPAEFDQIMSARPVQHSAYPSDARYAFAVNGAMMKLLELRQRLRGGRAGTSPEHTTPTPTELSQTGRGS